MHVAGSFYSDLPQVETVGVTLQYDMGAPLHSPIWLDGYQFFQVTLLNCIHVACTSTHFEISNFASLDRTHVLHMHALISTKLLPKLLEGGLMYQL